MEHCTIDDLGIEITGEDSPPLIDAINAYLVPFAKPVKDGDREGNILIGNVKCLNCFEILTGACGSFQWGLAHGEGNCCKCGWPARAYHRPEYDGEEIFDRALQRILQYHPDYVKTKEDSCSNSGSGQME
jgi:hypothetical protein